MAVDAFAGWYVQSVTVDTITGHDAWGQPTVVPHTVACWLEDKVQLVRSGTGEETVSSTTLYAALDQAAHFPAGSVVHLPSGRTAQVITCGTGDSTTGDELDGIAVTLT